MARKLLKLNRLKVKAWGLFSKVIRLTAAKKLDRYGLVLCVTCKSPHFWKDIQGGHFIHGHYKLTYLDERNVHPQCVQCNKFKSGNLNEYEKFMRETYGQPVIDELAILSHQVWKPSRDYYDEVIEKYSKLLEKLNSTGTENPLPHHNLNPVPSCPDR